MPKGEGSGPRPLPEISQPAERGGSKEHLKEQLLQFYLVYGDLIPKSISSLGGLAGVRDLLPTNPSKREDDPRAWDAHHKLNKLQNFFDELLALPPHLYAVIKNAIDDPATLDQLKADLDDAKRGEAQTGKPPGHGVDHPWWNVIKKSSK